jgi:hypothetical protein
MSNKSRHLAFALSVAAIVLPCTGARAQWYSSVDSKPAPLYPYAVQQPYAVEVAPNTYVIHRSNAPGVHPYPGRREHMSLGAPATPASEPRRTHADRALIEELRKRSHIKTKIVNTTKIEREAPIIVEHKRYVDDPPRIIERRHIIEDAQGRGLIRHSREVGEEDVVIQPAPAPEAVPAPHRKHAEKPANTPRVNPNDKRVIQADAEITILGPDRMSIRLFRKGRGSNAKAEAVE